MKNKLLLFLLGILGFSSCGDNMRNEYGTPHTDYRISGKVTDPAGTPIAHILVTRSSYEHGVRTDAQGVYTMSDDRMGSFKLLFTDTDGPANGGSFKEKSVRIEFTEQDKIAPGDGNWYYGEYAKTVDVMLEELD